MEFQLRYSEVAREAWEALAHIPRTGWVKRGIENPETVQAYIIDCRKTVMDSIDYLEYHVCEIFQILNMLEVHNYPKIITGDMVNLTTDREEKKMFRQKKFKLEHDAMIAITKDLGPVGKEMFALWLRFAKGEDKLAIFAKEVGKYQTIEKAWEYEQFTKKVKAKEFIDYYRENITHPLLKLNISMIEDEIKDTPL